MYRILYCYRRREKFKISKRIYKDDPFEVGELITITSKTQKHRKRKVGEDKNGKPQFEEMDDFDVWCTYCKVNIEKFNLYINTIKEE